MSHMSRPASFSWLDHTDDIWWCVKSRSFPLDGAVSSSPLPHFPS
jgi:hypothetical protein